MKAKAIITVGLIAALLGAATPLYARDQNSGPAPGSQSAGQYGQPPSQPPPPIDRASRLIGTKIKNSQNQNLGTVTDVVFDIQTGRISYLVVKKEGRHQGGNYAAIPPSALTPSQDMKSLMLNADKKQFENSQGFSRNNYPPMGEPAFGAQPEQQQPQEILIVPIIPNDQSTPGQNHENEEDQDHNQQSTPNQSKPSQGPSNPE